MTGFTDNYTYSDIIRAGAADFIAKPFQTSELKAKIERIDHERKVNRRTPGIEYRHGRRPQRMEKERAALGEDVVSNVSKLILPYPGEVEKRPYP